MKKTSCILAALLLLALAFHAAAQIPRTLSYQGVLTDAAGKPRPEGNYTFIFRLYDVASGGTAIWSESKTLFVKGGLFSMTLGDQTPFGGNVKFDRQYWLGIQVDNEPELAPRIALTSVGYSMSSLRADTATVAMATNADTTWQHDGSNIYRLHGKVGIGTNNPLTKLHVNGQSLWLTGGNGATFPVGSSGEGLRMYYDEANKFGMVFAWDFNNSVPRALSLQEPGGNVGIGTFGPVKRLHVVGNGIRLDAGDDVTVLDLKTDFEGGSGLAITTYTKSLSIGSQAGVLINALIGHGNVGIGTENPTTKLHVEGTTTTKVLAITGGADLAEPFLTSESESLPLGTVVVIDENNSGHLKLSRQPYDKGVAGIVSGAGGINPGLTLRQEGMMEGGQLVALTGKVYALATTANGQIKPGDLLTTSDVAGHAMKATDRELSHGAVIGKAMSRLEQGEGLVLVLVNLQ